MAIEWILNSAMNRFQLNYKRHVGPVSENIRKCAPKSKEEWRKYYFQEVYPEEHITELGKRLHIKITEVISAEVENVTEEDCINYMFELIIDRTYEGYKTEIHTIYGQLEDILSRKVHPAKDKWDRQYNVDFYIEVKQFYIGLQIKPLPREYPLPQIHKERKIQGVAHKKFTQKYGGAVFYIYSQSKDRKKTIKNPEVIEEIQTEILRLEKLNAK